MLSFTGSHVIRRPRVFCVPGDLYEVDTWYSAFQASCYTYRPSLLILRELHGSVTFLDAPMVGKWRTIIQ